MILRAEGIRMKVIVLKVRWAVKERLRKDLRRVRDAATELRS